MAVCAAETGRETLMFLMKEAVRLALEGTALGVACDGCPPLTELCKRYQAGGGRCCVCPIGFDTEQLENGAFVGNAELRGIIPMWQWIGDVPATTFSY